MAEKLWCKCSKAEKRAVSNLQKECDRLNSELYLGLIDKETYRLRAKLLLEKIDRTEAKYAD